MKIPLLSVLICLLPAPVATAPQAPDVETVIAHGLEALGGIERLKAQHSRSLSGEAHFNGGAVSGTFTWRQKRPDRLRLEFHVQGNTLLQGTNGRQAWQVQPVLFGGSGQPEVLQGPAAESVFASAVFESPLVDYRSKGTRVELLGLERVESRPTHHLKITSAEGRVTHLYLDAESFLGLKTVVRRYNPRSGAEDEVVQLIGGYREIDGIMVPHHLESRVGGQTVTELRVETVELNAKLADDLFEMPENG